MLILTGNIVYRCVPRSFKGWVQQYNSISRPLNGSIFTFRKAWVSTLCLIHQRLGRCGKKYAGAKAMADGDELIKSVRCTAGNCADSTHNLCHHRALCDPIGVGFLDPKGQVLEGAGKPGISVPAYVDANDILLTFMTISKILDQLGEVS